jgi:hypothetical protein
VLKLAPADSQRDPYRAAGIVLSFEADGFLRVHGVLSSDDCELLLTQVNSDGGPGRRDLLLAPWCRDVAQRLQQHPVLRSIVPTRYVPWLCTRFEKSAATNWQVPMHQDLSVPAWPGSNGAVFKDGIAFAQPGAAQLAQMVALRLHLDDCGEHDGPLRVVPGSHRHGVLDSRSEASLRSTHAEVVCTAKPGDVLALRPLLLHASSKSSGNSRRRVLHFLFGPRSSFVTLEH